MGLATSRQEAFWEACGFGHLERARKFLEDGDIDVNWVSYTNDCCPIHVASQGKPDIVKLLLEHKCDVNVRDSRGNSPLQHAAMKGHIDIVEMLLDAGTEINAQEKNGWTSLHNAAYWCYPKVVKVLVERGCDIHLQNKDERTALHECARSQHRDEIKLGEIAEILIGAGSDINSKSSDWGEADLTALMYASFHNHPDVATALIKARCELNVVGATFWTALHWAADRGHDELVYLLLEANADPTVRDMRGETAKDRAQSDHIREVLNTAIEIHKNMNKVKTHLPIKSLPTKPSPVYQPQCDANFKSQSFLPKDWKPHCSVNIKNLINEKKSQLTEKYRNELARQTGTFRIERRQDAEKQIGYGMSDIDLKEIKGDNVQEKEQEVLVSAVQTYTSESDNAVSLKKEEVSDKNCNCTQGNDKIVDHIAANIVVNNDDIEDNIGDNVVKDKIGDTIEGNIAVNDAVNNDEIQNIIIVDNDEIGDNIAVNNDQIEDNIENNIAVNDEMGENTAVNIDEIEEHIAVNIAKNYDVIQSSEKENLSEDCNTH